MAVLVELTPQQRMEIMQQLINFFIPYVPGTWQTFVINYINDHADYYDPKFDLTLYQVQAAIEQIVEENR